MTSSVLIAGFGPFPTAPINPSGTLAEQCAAGAGGAARSLVLPVEWDRAWPVLEAGIRESGAASVLLFGLHQRIERIRLETLARNRRELGRVDAAGGFPSGPAVTDGPDTLPCSLPWGRVARALRAINVDFEWSCDAGSYLCNDTLYRLAHDAGRLGVRRFGFVHVPLSDEAVAASLETETMPSVFCSLPEATLARIGHTMIEACRA